MSFDKEATKKKAKELIALYESVGVKKERILIKIASTWEGIQAARELERDGGVVRDEERLAARLGDQVVQDGVRDGHLRAVQYCSGLVEGNTVPRQTCLSLVLARPERPGCAASPAGG